MDWLRELKRLVKWTLWTTTVGGGMVIALSYYSDDWWPILYSPELHAELYNGTGAPITIERVTYGGETMAENVTFDEQADVDLGQWSRGEVFEITVRRERGGSETRAFRPYPSGTTDYCFFEVYISAEAVVLAPAKCL